MPFRIEMTFRRLFFLILLLGVIIGISYLLFASKVFSTPSLYSEKSLERSLGVDSLGKKFVLHRRNDRDRYDLVCQSLVKLQREIEENVRIKKTLNASSLPKKFHFIAPFDRSLTDDEEAYISSWKVFHPEWDCEIWSESDIKNLFGDQAVQYDLAPPKVRRDWYACLLLHNEGGVIIDLDIECIRPLNDIFDNTLCFVTFEPPLYKPLFERRLHFSPSIVAAPPRHEISARWLQYMSQRISSTLGRKGQKRTWKIKEELFCSLDSLGLCVDELLQQKNNSILVLGPTYFCPINPSHISGYEAVLSCESDAGKLRKVLGALGFKKPPPFSRPKIESKAINHSGGRLSSLS